MFYENYLNSLKPDMSFIPESASFTDASIFTERAIQDAFNEAFIGLAMNEMTMFEKVLNEADGDASENAGTSPEAKKKKLESIGKFFKTIWEKVKGFFMTLLTKIKLAFAKFNKEKGNTIIKDFTKSLAEIGKKNSNFSVESFPANTKKTITDKIDKEFSKLYSIASGAKSDIESKNSTDLNSDTIDKLVNEAKDQMDKIQKTNMSISDLQAASASIQKIVVNASEVIKDVKDNYNKAKKMVDDLMKSAKELVNKNKDAKEYLKIASKLSGCITKVQSIQLSKVKEVRSNYITVIAKVIATGKRAVKEDTEITIDVQENPDEDTKVDVNASGDAEVTDNVDEAFSAFLEEDEPDDFGDEDEDKVPVDNGRPVEESALYRAIVSYLD